MLCACVCVVVRGGEIYDPKPEPSEVRSFSREWPWKLIFEQFDKMKSSGHLWLAISTRKKKAK